jgi:uncharacterized protein YbbC (DUF1343 family)
VARIEAKKKRRLGHAGWLLAIVVGGAWAQPSISAPASATPAPVPGIEVLLQSPDALLRGKRIGLVTNPTGVDRQLVSDIDLLAKSRQWHLVALFGPEHGVRGQAQAGQHVDTDKDPATGLPVHSLYGATLEPTPQMLQGIDVLVFDIQDVGARFYTYPYTLANVLHAAKRAGIPVVVLDRPNPIGGLLVEGPVLKPAYASFVGLFPIPLRHGMTIGELAMLFNGEYGIGADLHVVRMQGWRRGEDAIDLRDAMPWVPPSPNIPTPDTALVYPGIGLFEGTNISEGRGTTHPFEIVGAPFVEPQQLADYMNARSLPGVRFRPLYFTPTFSKFSGQSCGGVQIHVMDRHSYRPVRTGIALLQALHALYPDQLKFIPGEPPVFDRLGGNGWLREAIEAGQPLDRIEARWQPELERFEAIRARYLLY